MPSNELDIEAAVNQRYAGVPSTVEAELYGHVSHDTSQLAPIPAEAIEREYDSTISVTGDRGTAECC
jgi:hypothetical protein